MASTERNFATALRDRLEDGIVPRHEIENTTNDIDDSDGHGPGISTTVTTTGQLLFPPLSEFPDSSVQRLNEKPVLAPAGPVVTPVY